MFKFDYLKVIKYYRSLNLKTRNDIINALDSFSILFAYNSGVIENSKITYHDTREIFENGKVTSYTGDLRTLYEISNQKICLNYLIDKILKKEKLSEDIIKKAHKLLTRGTYDERRYNLNKERPGEYKKHDYVTGIEEIGVRPEDVHDEMVNLLNDINNINLKNDEDIISMVAYFHNVFEEIHPFADGNGRLGRCLMNYLLMINNLPPIIIYNEDKKYYYECLEKFDQKDDLKPIIEFIKYEMEKTWSKTLNRDI